MSSTRISRHVNAARAAVYEALLDARAVATWMVPAGMTSHVHQFDAREGGSFRISLTYHEPTGTGKTTAHTDTFHGPLRQARTERAGCRSGRVRDRRSHTARQMTITITLAVADGGTDIFTVHDGLLPGLSTAGNETGW